MNPAYEAPQILLKSIYKWVCRQIPDKQIVKQIAECLLLNVREIQFYAPAEKIEIKMSDLLSLLNILAFEFINLKVSDFDENPFQLPHYYSIFPIKTSYI